MQKPPSINSYTDKITYTSPRFKSATSRLASKDNLKAQLYAKIIRLNDHVIIQAINQKQYKTTIDLLNQLENFIQKQDYSLSNKKFYFYHISICYYNRACLYFLNQDGQRCLKNLEKAIENFQIVIGFAVSRQQIVSLNVEYSKMIIQLCAVLSQFSRHTEAIMNAQKTLNKLIECFRILYAICQQNILISTDSESTQASLQNNQKRDKVDFKRIIIKQAQRKLQQLANLPSIHRLLQYDKQYYQQIMYIMSKQSKKIYYWTKNAQNNQKILRKELDLDKGGNPTRNLLGINKSSHSLQDFHIGLLMRLKPKKIKNEISYDRYHLLSSDYLLQLTIYCSVSYFTIATETRFNEIQQDFQTLKITQKYEKLYKDETIAKCKLFHIKAIELAGKYLPSSNFFVNHLLGSFNKNYKVVLDQIKQYQKQQSQSTLKYIQLNDDKTNIYQYPPLISDQKLSEKQKKLPKKKLKNSDKFKSKSQTTLIKKINKP